MSIVRVWQLFVYDEELLDNVAEDFTLIKSIFTGDKAFEYDVETVQNSS